MKSEAEINKLAKDILGAECACYADAWPAQSCNNAEMETVRLIRAFLSAPSAPAPPIADDAALVEAVAKEICKADGFDPIEDSFPMHADPAKNQPYPAWHDYMSHARFAISAARSAIEAQARRKALDEAAGVCDAFADNQDKTVKALVVRRAILALKDKPHD